jgi:hypothetical protein
MWIIKSLLLTFACVLCAAAPPALNPQAPPASNQAPLLPGEALAIVGPDGVVHLFGEDASRELPMGSLAKLVWIKLAGMDWASMDVQFNCTGTWQGCHCWLAKGHGKVDLAKALQESCNLAFLAWGRWSAGEWKRDYGEGGGRALMEDAFGPFLGDRMPPGEGIPAIEPPWIGDGDLLRASPATMLTWLQDPAQEAAVRMTKRLLLSNRKNSDKPGVWWINTGTAPVPGDPGSTSAWAAGSNGSITAVLHLPRGRGKADGLDRFRAVMMIPPGL